MLWLFETPFSLKAKEFLTLSRLTQMKPTVFTLFYTMIKTRLQQPYAYQGQGLGSILLKEAEDFAQEQSFQTISLHAQLRALKFYLNNGYQEVGKIFEEAGIQHITVEKSLISKKA